MAKSVTNKVEAELAKACDAKRKDGESNDAYRKRLLRLADKLSDAAYEKLSDDAQSWISDAVKASKKEQPLPAFPGEAAADEDDDRSAKKPAAKTAGKASAPAAKAAPKKATAPEKASKPEKDAKPAPKKAAEKKGPGLSTRLKQLLIKKPNMPTVDLLEKLQGEGFDTTHGSVMSLRSDFRHSLKTLQDAGKLEGIEI